MDRGGGTTGGPLAAVSELVPLVLLVSLSANLVELLIEGVEVGTEIDRM